MCPFIFGITILKNNTWNLCKFKIKIYIYYIPTAAISGATHYQAPHRAVRTSRQWSCNQGLFNGHLLKKIMHKARLDLKYERIKIIPIGEFYLWRLLVVFDEHCLKRQYKGKMWQLPLYNVRSFSLIDR